MPHAPCRAGLTRLAFYPSALPDQGTALASALGACSSLHTLQLGGSGGPALQLHARVWQALAALPALQRVSISHAHVAPEEESDPRVYGSSASEAAERLPAARAAGASEPAGRAVWPTRQARSSSSSVVPGPWAEGSLYVQLMSSASGGADDAAAQQHLRLPLGEEAEEQAVVHAAACSEGEAAAREEEEEEAEAAAGMRRRMGLAVLLAVAQKEAQQQQQLEGQQQQQGAAPAPPRPQGLGSTVQVPQAAQGIHLQDSSCVAPLDQRGQDAGPSADEELGCKMSAPASPPPPAGLGRGTQLPPRAGSTKPASPPRAAPAAADSALGRQPGQPGGHVPAHASSHAAAAGEHAPSALVPPPLAAAEEGGSWASQACDGSSEAAHDSPDDPRLDLGSAASGDDLSEMPQLLSDPDECLHVILRPVDQAGEGVAAAATAAAGAVGHSTAAADADADDPSPDEAEATTHAPAARRTSCGVGGPYEPPGHDGTHAGGPRGFHVASRPAPPLPLEAPSGAAGPGGGGGANDPAVFRTSSLDDQFDADLLAAIELSKLDVWQADERTAGGQAGGAGTGAGSVGAPAARPDSPSRRDCWGWFDEPKGVEAGQGAGAGGGVPWADPLEPMCADGAVSCVPWQPWTSH